MNLMKLRRASTSNVAVDAMKTATPITTAPTVETPSQVLMSAAHTPATTETTTPTMAGRV
jgi:hypothetical protein